MNLPFVLSDFIRALASLLVYRSSNKTVRSFSPLTSLATELSTLEKFKQSLPLKFLTLWLMTPSKSSGIPVTISVAPLRQAKSTIS